jgi:hypothetical protein
VIKSTKIISSAWALMWHETGKMLKTQVQNIALDRILTCNVSKSRDPCAAQRRKSDSRIYLEEIFKKTELLRKGDENLQPAN